MTQIETWLDKGLARIILGTVALRDPALVKDAARRFPGRIAVGIDARNGKVAVEGWAKASDITATELALRFEDAGVAAIIFTDIDRDGALAGVNVAATAALAQKLKTPVIASGGVASIDDVTALKAQESTGIAGAILGRALYDGRIDLNAALAIAD
jgi:phosphoribosylformimino-5-aminoimidazole carboxamide ribotide isomerase